MLTLGPGAPAGSNVKAIISSGDEFGDFTFEGIPDGIGFVDQGPRVDVYVTHEQSRVPFPLPSPTVTGLRDFVDSSISRLTVNVGGKVLAAQVALPPSAGFIRFCSAFMAGVAEGFTSSSRTRNRTTTSRCLRERLTAPTRSSRRTPHVRRATRSRWT
jgi:hypothetical protein